MTPNSNLQQKLKDHYQYIILDGLPKEMELFLTNTAYGPNLLLPIHLKDANFSLELKILIEKSLLENKKIPETALMRRLILITKKETQSQRSIKQDRLLSKTCW